jgi:hypothetical protein
MLTGVEDEERQPEIEEGRLVMVLGRMAWPPFVGGAPLLDWRWGLEEEMRLGEAKLLVRLICSGWAPRWQIEEAASGGRLDVAGQASSYAGELVDL